MLEQARARGLDVREASVTSIPFPDESFDVTCAFKVLAHVPEIGRALAEMARVTRPGGVVVAEFYNPVSLRGVVKRMGPAAKISSRTRESAVYTRFDAPWIVPRLLPPSLSLEAVRGVRIVTPAAARDAHPRRSRPILRSLEHAARRFAGRVLRRLLRRGAPQERRDLTPSPRRGAPRGGGRAAVTLPRSCSARSRRSTRSGRARAKRRRPRSRTPACSRASVPEQRLRRVRRHQRQRDDEREDEPHRAAKDLDAASARRRRRRRRGASRLSMRTT